MVTLVLASASPARRRLLENAGINPVVCPSDFDESSIAITDPEQLVKTLAQKKAETIAPQYPDALILGCDSVLEVAGQIHGKPIDSTEAIARWKLMAGLTGKLYTGHCLISPKTPPLVECGITGVEFAPVSEAEIQAYVATGEPLKCAGCFALEGKGGLFVEKLDGCHSNVIGLSLPLLRRMLAQRGYSIYDFWA